MKLQPRKIINLNRVCKSWLSLHSFNFSSQVGSSWLIQYHAVLSSDQDVRNVDSFDNLLNMLFKFARVGEFG